ncbi:MAG TPA: hypothetical protein VK756_09920 [Solirubrobacteraceae bacterium]|jgi:hypothetical protein|nr:hypothetical protein [Solirubrobacteraceae bacterium]
MRLLPLHARSVRGRGRLIADLRLAIDCLPVATREAMLAAARDPQTPIVAGAYVDGEGGVCPMLAAHRRGARADMLAFARAWDRFVEVGRAPRRATPRELGVLVAHLEASLLQDAAPDLGRAIAEHRKTVELRDWRASREAARRRREGSRSLGEIIDPRGEIRARRLKPRVRSPLRRPRYSASPGRVNMISGITHAGEVLSR